MGVRTAWRVGDRTLLARTCGRCGVLKRGDEFRKDPRGFTQTHCKVCQHASAKKADKRTNAETQETAVKSKQPWTTGDIKLLDELTTQGLSTRVIAEKMGRSLQAVYIARSRFSKDS